MNIPKPSPHDLEILGRLEDEYQVADRFSSGSVEAKHIRLIAHLQSQIATLTAERDEARKELAAPRSAPGMEEVDAILNDVNSSMFANQERLSDKLRTAILAHEREKQRADEADARYDRFVSEWFEEDADYQRLVDVAESHIDPDCWLAKECQRIHEIFLKRFEEEQQIEEEQQND